MASPFDWLFGSGGDTPPPAVTTTTQSQNLPEWYQEYIKAIIGKGAEISKQPYTPYGGPRVAGFTPDQTSAFDATRANTGTYSPYGVGSFDMLTEGGGDFDSAAFNSYLSPYTEGVVNRISDLGARNLSEKLLPTVNKTFTGAGQFGSSRHADFTNRAVRDTNESVLAQQAASLESANTNAMQAYSDAMARKIGAGRELVTSGEAAQGAGLRDAAALEAIGGTQQQQGQKGMDLAYEDFVAQRDYDKNQTRYVSELARGFPQPVSTATTVTAPGTPAPSPVSQLGGLALGGYGLSKLLKKGGRVTPMRSIGGMKMAKRYANG